MEKLFNLERPQTLSSVKGHSVIVQRVSKWVESGNIPSFILLHGCKGCGKTTVARIISKSANCENPTKDGPCGVCESCKAAATGSNMDILELDAASKNKVEDVEKVVEKLQYVPYYKKRVCIFDEVHRLSDAAFSSLLKVLEEPPEDVIFIFCTTEIHKIPDTIKSRARQLTFAALPVSVIVTRLEEICNKYSVEYEKDALYLIAKYAKGAMRDAVNTLEDYLDCDKIKAEDVVSGLGLADDDMVFSIVENIVQGNYNAVSIFRSAINKGLRVQNLIESIISVVLDVLQYKATDSTDSICGTDVYKEGIVALAIKATFSRFSEMISYFSSIRPVGLEPFQVEAGMVGLIVEESTVSRLEKEIEKLKADIKNGSIVSAAPVVTALPSVPVDVCAKDDEPSYVLPEEEIPFESLNMTELPCNDVCACDGNYEPAEQPCTMEEVVCDASAFPCEDCDCIDTCDGSVCYKASGGFVDIDSCADVPFTDEVVAVVNDTTTEEKEEFVTANEETTDEDADDADDDMDDGFFADLFSDFVRQS